MTTATIAAPVFPRVYDAAFQARWDAWLLRGRANHERVQRRLFVMAGVLPAAAAVLYAAFR